MKAYIKPIRSGNFTLYYRPKAFGSNQKHAGKTYGGFELKEPFFSVRKHFVQARRKTF